MEKVSKLGKAREQSLPNKGETAEVAKMRRCKVCGRLKTQVEADDLYCGQCEKIEGDVLADWQAELCG